MLPILNTPLSSVFGKSSHWLGNYPSIYSKVGALAQYRYQLLSKAS